MRRRRGTPVGSYISWKSRIMALRVSRRFPESILRLMPFARLGRVPGARPQAGAKATQVGRGTSTDEPVRTGMPSVPSTRKLNTESLCSLVASSQVPDVRVGAARRAAAGGHVAERRELARPPIDGEHRDRVVSAVGAIPDGARGGACARPRSSSRPSTPRQRRWVRQPDVALAPERHDRGGHPPHHVGERTVRRERQCPAPFPRARSTTAW